MDLKALLGDAYKEGMTFEEIEEALKEVQPPEDPAGAAEISRLKTALSKANGEAADYKKQLRLIRQSCWPWVTTKNSPNPPQKPWQTEK